LKKKLDIQQHLWYTISEGEGLTLSI
jgi:hypothetical protein